MPDDPRISRLLEQLRSPLSQDKLDSFTCEFEAWAQDRADPLVFFVLQHVSHRIATELDGEAMDAVRFEELTAGIADGVRDILVRLQESRAVATELEVLVVRLYRNLGVYRG